MNSIWALKHRQSNPYLRSARDGTSPLLETERRGLNSFQGRTTGNKNRFSANKQDNSTSRIVPGKDMVSLQQMGQVYQKTTIEIRHERVSELSSRYLPDQDCYHCCYYHDYDQKTSLWTDRLSMVRTIFLSFGRPH